MRVKRAEAWLRGSCVLRLFVSVLAIGGALLFAQQEDASLTRKVEALFAQLTKEEWEARKKALDKLAELAERNRQVVTDAIDRLYPGAKPALRDVLEKLCRRIRHVPWSVLDGLMRRVFGADERDSVAAQETLLSRWCGAKPSSLEGWRLGATFMQFWLNRVLPKKVHVEIRPKIVRLGQKPTLTLIYRADGWLLVPRENRLGVTWKVETYWGEAASNAYVIIELDKGSTTDDYTAPPYVLVKKSARFEIETDQISKEAARLLKEPGELEIQPQLPSLVFRPFINMANIPKRAQEMIVLLPAPRNLRFRIPVLPEDEGFALRLKEGQVQAVIKAPQKAEAGTQLRLQIEVRASGAAVMRKLSNLGVVAWAVVVKDASIVARVEMDPAGVENTYLWRGSVVLKQAGKYRIYGGILTGGGYAAAPAITVTLTPPQPESREPR